MRYLAVILLSSLCACSAPVHKPPKIDPTMKIDFESVEYGSDRPVTLSQSLAKYNFIHLWATWCPQCVQELGCLQSLRDQIGSNNFKIIAVAVHSDPAKIEEIRKEVGITFEIWNDVVGNSQKALKPASLPFTMMVDQNGLPISFPDPETQQLGATVTGARLWDAPQVVGYFQLALEK